MESKHKGQVALVTGAGARVGRRIALRLAESGMTIAAHYHTSRTGAEEVVREIELQGGRAMAFSADLESAGRRPRAGL